MHPALFKLIVLNLRAKNRRLFRGLRTVKGRVYTAISVACVALLFGPGIVSIALLKVSQPEVAAAFAPVALLGLCLLQLLSTKPEAGIPFLPAEVDILFPAPFSRRQLLAYKMLGMLLAAFFVSLMFSLYVLPFVPMWQAGFAGIFLGVVFAQLLQVAVVLFAVTLVERAFTLVRRVLLVGMGIAIAAALGLAISRASDRGLLPLLASVRQSWIGQVVLAPFEVFGRILGAESFFPALVGWGALGLAVDAGLFALILRLDANFMEASVAASQRLYDRMQNARRGNVWAGAKPVASRWTLPQLPWLAGAGPIAWRQMITAVRGARAMLFVMAIVAVSAGMPLLMNSRQRHEDAPLPLVIVGAMTVFMLPQLIRFDFRGDVDRIETLKTLPISPFAIVIGELLVPVLLTALLQGALVIVVALVLRGFPSGTGWALVFALPINLLVFGLENLVFLLYPSRPPAGGAIDLQGIGRQLGITLLKMLMLGVAGGAAGGFGGAIYSVSGSAAAGWACAWSITVLLAFAVVPVIARAYARFDPSTDTPP